MTGQSQPRPKAGLLVTCLVDLVRPSIGFAAARLIEMAGCDVVVPDGQTCCGQPAWNAGDRVDAAALARQTIAAFEGVEYIVVPSGSCAGMLKLGYVQALAGDPTWAAKAAAFAERVHELTSFLVDVRGLTRVASVCGARVTYHDACAGLRELGIKQQPRRLLSTVAELEIVEMADCDVCCGFGGTFATAYPDISNAMVSKKADHAVATGADILCAGDLGCLMNIAGKLSRQGSPIDVRHVAEILTGELDEPPICKS